MQKKDKNNIAQATLEFIFCFLVLLLIFYSCVRALQWVGVALVRAVSEQDQVAQNPPNDFDLNPGAIGQPLLQPSGEVPDLRLMFKGQLINDP